jgi:steroid 5-alpha reductase family enzyme
MWKTALLLLLTAVVVPVLAFTLDEPLTPGQREVLRRLVIIYLGSASACFLTSTLSKNYSQVDKLWSILPMVYAWIIAAGSGMEPRLILMALLVSFWGIRLTFNFSRRGGYSWKIWSGTEDYRWSLLRNRPGLNTPWKWALFNLLFISLYQMGIILLITLPALKSMGGADLRPVDLLLAFFLVACIVLETIADQQQWNHHKRRRELQEKGKPVPEKYRKGFVDYGLWKWVRHPNYASEQTVWILIYLFSIVATGRWLNWSVTGALLLVLLFWGSSNFSESISAGKYPEYAGYIKRVPRFIPFLKRNRT